MKYTIVDENRSELLSVACLCRAFAVSRSGFYDWSERLTNPSAAATADKKLESNVIRVHFESRKIYGHRKVQEVLATEGTKVGVKKVYALMARNDLKSKTKKAFKPQTTQSNHGNKISPRIFDNDRVVPKRPNQIWAGDITYIATREGWLYLSLYIDLFSRMVVGWAIREHMRVELVRESLVMAIKERDVGPGLIIHTDQGVQYTAGNYRSLLDALKFVQSMSRRGNCYDNAYVESFFSQMKKELSKKVFDTKAEAIKEIVDYITQWYNKERIHSSIGYLSPAQFEAEFEALAS